MQPLVPAGQDEEVSDKDGKHRVMLALDKEDYDKLRFLVSITKTNNNDVLRQCVRNQHEVNMAKIRKGGAV